MFQYRVAGSEWEDIDSELAEDDPACFLMEDRDCDYLTYDGGVPYTDFSGKVEYRRVDS